MVVHKKLSCKEHNKILWIIQPVSKALGGMCVEWVAGVCVGDRGGGWRGDAYVILFATYQMSKFYWEAPVGGFLDGHGFDLSSTKHKSSIAREKNLHFKKRFWVNINLR